MSRSPERDDALQIVAFPVLLTIGILLIPVVPDYSDDAAAARATQHSGLWLLGHLLSAAAFATSVQCSAVLQRLTGRPSPWITLVIGLGAGLHAAGLGADGIGPLALNHAGQSATTFFRGSTALVPAVFIAGAVLFGVAQFIQTWQVTLGSSVPRRLRLLLFALLFSAAEAIPSGWGLYVVAASAVGLYLPLAASVRRSEWTASR
jgi:hypothetical protein